MIFIRKIVKLYYMDIKALEKFSSYFGDMDLLLSLNFDRIGFWKLYKTLKYDIFGKQQKLFRQNLELDFEKLYESSCENGIYAFTLTKEYFQKIVYIGKSEQDLWKRLDRYKNPNKNKTNKRISFLIKKALKQGFYCHILYLKIPNKYQVTIQGLLNEVFKNYTYRHKASGKTMFLDIVNSLEISLIKNLYPIWNKQHNPLFDTSVKNDPLLNIKNNESLEETISGLRIFYKKIER